MAEHDHALSRLLAGRDSLSRPEREEIFDAVWTGVSAEETTSRSEARRNWLGVVLAFAVAAGLMLAVGLAPPSDTDSEFGVRGLAAGPVLTLLCGGAARGGTCSSGEELSFEVAGARDWSYIALFGRRPDDTVIWYAPPNEDESSAALERGVETTLVPRTVALGPEHPPGHYLITAVLSHRPLSREDVRRRLLLPAPGEDLAVVEQKLEIR
jgi:hypothetical protein